MGLSRNISIAGWTSGMLADERLRSAAIVCVVVCVSAVVYLFDPATSSFYAKCPFHWLTGLHCAGCGTLRSSHQLLHLNIAAALRFNALTVLSMPFLMYAFFSRALIGLRGKPLPGWFVPARLIWALFVGILAFWFLRNIPLYPFSLLAPAG
jgi:hypothetical protein